ncbi:MAG: hypothetical protein V2I97_02090 [Desulfococcaceae bacterium]|jgi:hypothetical protein|nr:hypothetical protein [Desulfococcaceae bacterium]
MKNTYRIAITVLLFACFFSNSFRVPDSMAGTLAEDYNALVSKRVELEDVRKKHESRLSTLSSQKKSLTIVFYKCVSGEDKEFWEKKLNESEETTAQLEAERKELAELRQHVSRIRRDLEKRRVSIEENHKNKGPGTPYETEFRAYMAALQKDYFDLLTGELFKGYEAYLAHLEAYNASLKESVGKCMKREI